MIFRLQSYFNQIKWRKDCEYPLDFQVVEVVDENFETDHISEKADDRRSVLVNHTIKVGT